VFPKGVGELASPHAVSVNPTRTARTIIFIVFIFFLMLLIMKSESIRMG